MQKALGAVCTSDAFCVYIVTCLTRKLNKLQEKV